MNKLIIGFFIFILVFVAIVLFHSKTSGGLGSKYQGPVPKDYDEQHYRNTGETIKMVDMYYNIDDPNQLLIKNDKGEFVNGNLSRSS